MSLPEAYTNEEKRKLKLCRLSNDKHSISADSFVLGCRSMADEIAELREALKENERLITYLIENLSVKELEEVEDKIVEVSLKNLKLLNK